MCLGPLDVTPSCRPHGLPLTTGRRRRRRRAIAVGRMAGSAKASARRSVSRVLSRRAPKRAAGDGHPSEAAGRPTAHAADPRAGQRTSPPSTVARRRVAPSYLALLRVEFAAFHSVAGPRPAGRHRHCGTGPRLTADGRYPPPCAAELGLSSRRDGSTPADARPSDRLADRTDPTPAAAADSMSATGRPSTAGRDDRRRPAGQGPVDRLVRAARRRPSSGRAARAPRTSGRTPASVPRAADQSGMSLASLTRQRPVELLDDELRIEQQARPRAPRARAARSSARTTPVYSATLLVWMPR